MVGILDGSVIDTALISALNLNKSGEPGYTAAQYLGAVRVHKCVERVAGRRYHRKAIKGYISALHRWDHRRNSRRE